MKTAVVIASGIFLLGLAAASAPAQAKTMKECAAEWKAMKAANQTGGMKYRDFSKQCMSGEAAPAGTPPAAETTTPPAPPPAAETKAPPPAAETKAPPPPAPVATGNIVFPSAVSPKYSSESAGKARMLTCRDQYEANKPTNANGGLKWIQKGGGYYSQCNKHLKGQA